MKKITLSLIYSLFALSVFAQGPASFLTFPGDGSIDCGVSTPFFNDSLTIEAWIKPSSGNEGSSSIMGAETNDGVVHYGFLVRLNDDDKTALDFCVVNNAWSNVTTPTGSIPADTWSHIAITFDTETAKIYVNGVEVVSFTFDPPYALSEQKESKLIIGDLYTYSARQYTGDMGDVRIWNVVRTASEISDNYQDYLTGDQVGLVANWKMDATQENNVLVDATSNFNGTISWFEASGLYDASSENKLDIDVLSKGGNLVVSNNNSSMTSISVIALSGVVVSNFNISSNETMSIPCKSGLYIVSCRTNQTTYTGKILIK